MCAYCGTKEKKKTIVVKDLTENKAGDEEKNKKKVGLCSFCFYSFANQHQYNLSGLVCTRI